MDTPTNINTRLREKYGLHPQLDVPKYRVVRSDKETEKRKGDYNLYTESGIFIRREFGVREICKYWYIPPCWILERAEPNNRPDLIDEKFTYEPLMTFLDKDNKDSLPLTWRAVEYLVTRFEFMANNKPVVKSEEDWKKEEEKEMQVESDKILGIIDAPEPVKELPTFKSMVEIKNE